MRIQRMSKTRLILKIILFLSSFLLLSLSYVKYKNSLIENNSKLTTLAEDEMELRRLWSSYIEKQFLQFNEIKAVTVNIAFPDQYSSHVELAISISFRSFKGPSPSVLKSIEKILTSHILFPVYKENISVFDQNGMPLRVFN